jgi:hypothetical protein
MPSEFDHYAAEYDKWIVRRCPVDIDVRLLTVGGVRRLMRAAALKIVEASYFLYFPESFHRLLASLERKLRQIPLGGQDAVFGRR